jgi:hypothetical protein
MQPGEGLIWGSDGGLPAPQGRFFAFDQRSWRRRPDLDLRPSGFRAALACADAWSRHDSEGAWIELEKALGTDGETALLVLMRSLLKRERGDADGAQRDLRFVAERWADTPVGAVARAWAEDQDADLPPIPFPSAIAPRLGLHAIKEIEERVQRYDVPDAPDG